MPHKYSLPRSQLSAILWRLAYEWHDVAGSKYCRFVGPRGFPCLLPVGHSGAHLDAQAFDFETDEAKG
jgi:hypothetical protein